MNDSQPTGPAAPDTRLADIQHWFQAVIAHPDGVRAGAAAQGGEELLEETLTRSATLDAAGRLSVYADAYFARLIECMSEVFPMMRKFLGEEPFDSLAFEYLQEMPSKSYTLHHLGRHFPAWLEDSRARAEEETGVAPASAGADWPELLVDLARMEWAVYETFDGHGMEDEPALEANALLGLPPNAWDAARLQPAPCLTLLTARFPVNAFYTTLRQAKEGEDSPPPDPRPSWTALNRRAFIVRRHDLCETSHALLKAILNGRSLAESIDAAAAAWPDSDESLATALRAWFGEWAEEGFFRGIVAPPPGYTVTGIRGRRWKSGPSAWPRSLPRPGHTEPSQGVGRANRLDHSQASDDPVVRAGVIPSFSPPE